MTDPKAPESDSRTAPRTRPGLSLPQVAVIVVIAALVGRAQASGPEERVRDEIRAAYQANDHARVIDLADRAIAKKIPLESASDCVAQSLMAVNQYEKAGRLISEGAIVPTQTSTYDFVGMGLQTAGTKQMEYGVTCLKKAVAMSPDAVHLNYDYALLLWNAGHTDEAKAQCDKVVKMDPTNNGALQLLERLEKRDYASRTAGKNVARRKVTFTIKLPKGEAPWLAGSWNPAGVYDQLRGWKRERMALVRREGDQAVYGLSRELTTEEGAWYSALVAFTPEPFAPAHAFCRFPLYPYESTEMKVALEHYVVEEPAPLLKPRPQPKARRGPRPRLLSMCLDSATWSVFMPYMQAGMMPRLAEMARNGVVAKMHSDPPVSAIAFDILNFGIGGEFTLVTVLGEGIELLKERGIDLLNYGGIAGKPHIWKTLAERGIPTLYASWGEQLQYSAGGKQTVHDLSLDADKTPLAGLLPETPEQKVLPFLPESERKSFTELKLSDTVIIDHYNMGVKKFYELLELMKKTRAEVVLTHLGFVDTGYHSFWDAMDSDVAFIKPDRPRQVRYARVIENQHRMMDVLLGDMQNELDLAYDSFILWSDHGTSGGFVKTYYGHDPNAMVVMCGPLFNRGVVLEKTMDIRDLTPTMLAALGQPIPKQFTGTPAWDAVRARAKK